jgi:hypothetical protein
MVPGWVLKAIPFSMSVVEFFAVDPRLLQNPSRKIPIRHWLFARGKALIFDTCSGFAKR